MSVGSLFYPRLLDRYDCGTLGKDTLLASLEYLSFLVVTLILPVISCHAIDLGSLVGVYGRYCYDIL